MTSVKRTATEAARELNASDPTLLDFRVWLAETQIDQEPVNGGVLAVLWSDFAAERGVR